VSALENYLDFYRNLSLETVERLREIAVSDIHFVDPFNDVQSVDSMIAIFKEMYSQCEDPCFDILEVAIGDQGTYLKWNCSFTPKTKLFNSGKKVSFVGISEIAFNDEGKLVKHLDYWDASRNFFEYIPALGKILKFFRKKLQVNHP
jgi:hypothetical protein